MVNPSDVENVSEEELKENIPPEMYAEITNGKGDDDEDGTDTKLHK